MTIINRFCPDFKDIKVIALECTHCGAMISYTPERWEPRLLDCPNCKATLVRARDNSGNESPELFALLGLAESLKLLMKLPEESKFRLRMEFDREGKE